MVGGKIHSWLPAVCPILPVVAYIIISSVLDSGEGQHVSTEGNSLVAELAGSYDEGVGIIDCELCCLLFIS